MPATDQARSGIGHGGKTTVNCAFQATPACPTELRLSPDLIVRFTSTVDHVIWLERVLQPLLDPHDWQISANDDSRVQRSPKP